ncbi:MAG: aspartate aminotransferase family protein [Melioribacteraceae bacterium]|nr:aspartate aminotransferase family protein [Melioribacteraceae bacterium]MCF8355067.1 aspartate aminotransferase family protein [Melioribacteraceae bacterium]MCF8395660.1 aspartate aminotransferase family protein [Melioribacteraceae bacterium]MCF8420285.1 aspartate aminotransferase family protein [Melioribacteraceae bacterium]
MNIREIDEKYYLPTFKRFPVTLVRGSNAKVWDDNGKEYIDALAGIAVNCLGHNNPAVVDALKNQAEKLIHVSNFFSNEPQALLAKKLAEISGLDRVFFGNSGAEAVEGAIKVARKYAHKNNRGGEVISFEGCFHGRTLATIAMGKEEQQKGFGPMPEGFHKAEFNNIDSVKKLITDKIAAIIVEPIQGEGGINNAEKSFLNELREVCDQNNIVLIFDEIQCGIARTGYMFAKDFYGVQPDILTSAKALGGGVPISAFICKEKIAGAIEFGDHGTTFGGNPLAASAALATLNEIEQKNIVDETRKKGEWFVNELRKKFSGNSSFVEIRGMGLMIGVVFKFETKELVAKMLEMGVIANATAGNVLRIVPPLTISYEELEKIIDVIDKALRLLNK